MTKRIYVLNPVPPEALGMDPRVPPIGDYVAVEMKGDGSLITTSPDSSTWTERSPAFRELVRDLIARPVVEAALINQKVPGRIDPRRFRRALRWIERPTGRARNPGRTLRYPRCR